LENIILGALEEGVGKGVEERGLDKLEVKRR
jgi:hypothetical protein